MSVKKLGRFAAGLVVALGLAFGGSLLGAADAGSNAHASSTWSSSSTVITADIDWA